MPKSKEEEVKHPNNLSSSVSIEAIVEETKDDLKEQESQDNFFK